MASDVEKLLDQAVSRGWRVDYGSKHRKIYSPQNKLVAVISRGHKGANYGSYYDLRAKLRKAGFDETKHTRLKEKSVTSVSDLIKANGAGTPLPTPTKPEPKRTRVNRSGLGHEILTVLKGAYPRDVDFTTLKMKVALNQPGVSQPTIHAHLSRLKKEGLVVNVRMGYWRAASADPVAVKPTPTPEATTPVLPEEAQKAIDDLMAAVVNVERVMRGLQSQLGALDEVKKLIGKLPG